MIICIVIRFSSLRDRKLSISTIPWSPLFVSTLSHFNPIRIAAICDTFYNGSLVSSQILGWLFERGFSYKMLCIYSLYSNSNFVSNQLQYLWNNYPFNAREIRVHYKVFVYAGKEIRGHFKLHAPRFFKCSQNIYFRMWMT